MSASAEMPHAPADDLCVARVPLFQRLTRAQQVDIAQLAHSIRAGAGEQLYSAGSSISQLMVVHTGQVKIARTSATGHEQSIRILGPGDFVGESAFLTGARPDHAAIALDPAELCVFRHSDLGRLIEQHPSIGLRMLQGVSARLEETERRLASIMTRTVDERLADYLLALPAERGDAGTLDVVLPVAKKEVAALLSTTPESLSRQLRKLADAGIVVPKDGGRITIAEPDALVALAAGRDRAG